ncbi:hypothetical protein CA11_09720 [Gimesia maris]|uniref:carboxypeptidase family protein n=1 Tax=Gimesia maris TaxID=122 RepID=UPI00118AE7DB|nr:carboxypeptidase family protein [Gimesia maris]QDU13190.1 hypothetical protein CA11_09720 [Gimesia maris]
MLFYEYYKKLDLKSLMQHFDNTDPERAKNVFYTEAVTAFIHKSEMEELGVDLLLKVLGEPDELIPFEYFDVWTYTWYGRHGPDLYLSFTPFKIQSNKVQFLERDEMESLKIDRIEITNKYIRRHKLGNDE